MVKELVENSLDAGASQIEVDIFAGGTEFIRVRDNGSGMDEANARMAILRHATSKIVKADDLLTLRTLGFRGEALPSIASVSHFTLLTREAGSEFATRIAIDGGEEMDVESMGGDVGTTITVKDLFYNVPARRKFLRTTNTEGRYISEILSKIALSRPDVHLTLTRDDKEVINTPGSGDILDTIGSLYGKEVTRELLTVDYTQEGISVKGYISRPTLLKGTRQWQTLFVNGRCINNRMVSKAIDHAYQSQIPKAGFPFAVLNIGIDTHLIDINVHPQKSEIKFGDESAVYRAVYHGLCQALTQPMAGRETRDGSVALAQPGAGSGGAGTGNLQKVSPAPETRPLFQGGDRGWQPRSTALYEAILRLDNLDDCIRFFEDLCAVTELRTMEQRYDVAGCLLQGKVYSEIRQLTGASSATVSRVNRMLNYGTGAVGKSVRYDLAAQQDGENSEGGTTE